ncbi:Uncharacterised protein (plasmid) [Tsukamurella tyrosinosolvens]|uniref:Uncharacterized protein n=1 Tax=Tsukamurella tyrosinosolvens TaxID=57704 RepID=A0A1H4YDH2_TSUTY|nr:hypothetical protein [Tsukamurella tyrosinosolvens]KXP00311.1 hypothetical protein AXK58_02785 [Tsukamurella tyrosinosolvens]SED15959.1 hypothetical protein SAMN04489793_4148 [Tsukamurella tyrosinosolvens]VEH91908.1 Uncharacterised protein [Tsukamurella tyrosinosolvens]
MYTTTLPAAPAATVRVEIDDDAAPVVRLIGRTLRDAVRLDHAPDVLGRGVGTVAVRSHSTPQAATVTFSDGAVTVTGGVFAPTDATVVVDLASRFASAGVDGDPELAGAMLRALQFPLPDWRTAGARFWEATRAIRGVPDVLVAVATGPDGREEARFGAGATTYRMVGTPDALAGVFTGADFLFTALERGLGVQGSMAQLSAMTAASWKARYDV